MRVPKLAERWSAIWPFSALCVLGGSRWLLEGARPEARSTFATQAVGCLGAAGILALGQVAFHLRRYGSGWGNSLSSESLPRLRSMLGGTLALAGTGLAATIGRRPVHTDDATLALALTPCVVAVGAAALGGAKSRDMTAGLWPGLAAVAGLLLLLPQPRIQDWRLGFALAGMPLLTGLGAVIFSATRTSAEATAKSHQDDAAAWFALLGAAAVNSMLAWLHGRAEGAPGTSFALTREAVGLDGAMALLTTMTLIRLGAVRWSAQFILLPLLALLEGVVFLRPELDIRSWLAFGLLLISGTYLFFTESGSADISIL